MKFVAILSLALALSVARADNGCTTYVCDPKNATWPSNACAMMDTKNNQYDIRSGYCSSDEYCIYSTLVTTSYCEKTSKPTPGQIAYPGEPCDDLNTCIGSTCTGGTCTGLSLNAKCTNVYDCGGSLTCPQTGANALKCTTVIAAGESGCYSDTDCVQNAGCVGASTQAGQETPGKCFEYLSIPAQSPAQACAAQSTSLVPNVYCQSGLCYLTSDTKAPTCADSVGSTGTLPVSCPGVGGCNSAADSKSTGVANEACVCGYSGNSYCPLFPGDSLMVDYLTNQMQYLNSTTLKKCNSYRNSSTNIPTFTRDYCDQMTSGVSKSVIYSHYKAVSYAMYVNADKCVLKAMAHDYYEYEDAASWIVLSGLVLALIY